MSKKRKQNRPRTTSTTNPAFGSDVYGESAVGVFTAYVNAQVRPMMDGSQQVEIALDPIKAQPLLRAMMRAEAELLIQDADRLTLNCTDMRTPEQRRADALLAVTKAAGRAVRR